MEAELNAIKASHFDKIDLIKRVADLEGRITYLTAERDLAVKERNRLELDLSKLRREKHSLTTQLQTQEAELELFKRTNEEHLDRFDRKFDELTAEFLKVKTENVELRERERAGKMRLEEME